MLNDYVTIIRFANGYDKTDGVSIASVWGRSYLRLNSKISSRSATKPVENWHSRQHKEMEVVMREGWMELHYSQLTFKTALPTATLLSNRTVCNSYSIN